MVWLVRNGLNLVLAYIFEAPFLGDVLPHQPISIFIEATFPRVIGTCEVRGTSERTGHSSVTDKPQTVVESQGVEDCPYVFQLVYDGFRDERGSLSLHLAQESVSGTAIHQGHNSLLLIGIDDGVALPVADAYLQINDVRYIFDSYAACYVFSGISTRCISLAALLLTAQIHVEFSACDFVGVDPAVHSFMADTAGAVTPHPLGCLVRTASVYNKLSGSHPCILRNARPVSRAQLACRSHLLGLLDDD